MQFRRVFRIALLSAVGFGLCLAYPVYTAWNSGFFDPPPLPAKFGFDMLKQTGLRDRLPIASEQDLLALPGLQAEPLNKRPSILRWALGRAFGGLWDDLIEEWSRAGPKSVTPSTVHLALDQAHLTVHECLRTFGRLRTISLTGSAFVIARVQSMRGGGVVVDVRVALSDFEDRVVNACLLVGLAQTPFPNPPGDGWYAAVAPWHIYPADAWEPELERLRRATSGARDAAPEATD